MIEEIDFVFLRVFGISAACAVMIVAAFFGMR